MFTQANLETILSAGIVLICLALSVNIYWILNGWQIEAIRRAFARAFRRWEKDHRVESYIKGLRALTEEDSYNKTYTNLDAEQITFSRKKTRN